MQIKRKKGVCKECDNNKEVYLFRSNPPECFYHYRKNLRIRYQERTLLNPKKAYKIKGYSEKTLRRLREYRKKRDAYIKANKWCEVKGCENRSSNLHHKAGRYGELLTNEKYFMACCSQCHPKKIHENPKWAREKGYILTIN